MSDTICTDKFLLGIRDSLNIGESANGAKMLKSTFSGLLDMSYKVAQYRKATEDEIIRDFKAAVEEDFSLALRFAFYLRDIRGGLGERRAFRVILKWLGDNYPFLATEYVRWCAEYGRWDDAFVLLDTVCGNEVITIIVQQLSWDIAASKLEKSVSLLGKWLPSENASSKQTKALARKIRLACGLTPRNYRRTLSYLRRYLDIVERKASAGQWSEIDYASVPSQANLRYSNSFLKHDEERRKEYLNALQNGETKINAGTLAPYQIVESYFTDSYWRDTVKPLDLTLEELWKALPNEEINDFILVVADGSSSMTSGNPRPLDVANSLAIYCAERAKGPFKDTYITFSENPQLVKLPKSSLKAKLEKALRHNEVANTDIYEVFHLILKTALKNRLTQAELPKSILIISDMQFDCQTTSGVPSDDETLFDTIKEEFLTNGYEMPKLIFWNVSNASYEASVPLKENKNGLILMSGFSPSLFRMAQSGEIDPLKALLEVLNSERYSKIDEEIKKYCRN